MMMPSKQRTPHKPSCREASALGDAVVQATVDVDGDLLQFPDRQLGSIDCVTGTGKQSRPCIRINCVDPVRGMDEDIPKGPRQRDTRSRACHGGRLHGATLLCTRARRDPDAGQFLFSNHAKTSLAT